MSGTLIRKGDATSHKGVVITGSEEDLLDGKPMARLGDLVDCPGHYPDGRPHGINKIITATSGLMLGDREAACAGDMTECGCTLLGSSDASAG
ncbi:PAAR domain-containing protein [Cupriavidus sp. CP313]